MLAPTKWNGALLSTKLTPRRPTKPSGGSVWSVRETARAVTRLVTTSVAPRTSSQRHQVKPRWIRGGDPILLSGSTAVREHVASWKERHSGIVADCQGKNPALSGGQG